MSRSAIPHPRALARAWPVRLLAAAGAALALAGRPAAEPGPRPGSRLGCEVALGPGAVGGVRYRAGAGRGTAGDLTVAVRLEPAAAGGPPLAAGDRLPVAITVGTAPPYLAGTVRLAWNGCGARGLAQARRPVPGRLSRPRGRGRGRGRRPALHAPAPRARALTGAGRDRRGGPGRPGSARAGTGTGAVSLSRSSTSLVTARRTRASATSSSACRVASASAIAAFVGDVAIRLGGATRMRRCSTEGAAPLVGTWACPARRRSRLSPRRCRAARRRSRPAR